MISGMASIFWRGARLGGERGTMRRRALQPRRRVAAVAMAVAALLGATQAVSAGDPPVPGSPAPLVALMAQLAQRKHGHIAYAEEHFIGTLERPLKSSGELLYDAPGRLEKRTLLPRPETVILDRGTMKAQRGRHTYVARLEDHPQLAPLIESIRAVLGGDLPTLEHLFVVAWQGSSEHWRLQLSPRSTDMVQIVRQINVLGSEDRIQSVEILQADGDRSLLTMGAEIPE
jgi:hypothetical protein